MTNTNKSELIDLFFYDSNVQRLVSRTAEWRPLQICFPKEVHVSRFLAWLLDPSEGHGLADWSIQSLLSHAWGEMEVGSDLQTMRFLAPANIQNESFSAAVVTTEVDLAGDSLDILIIDVSKKRYIAIENKFGARQGKNQLKKYRIALKKMFPEFLGIHIFLDANEAGAHDPSWISVGYGWIAELLRFAEQRNGLADQVKQTFAQFRMVIEDEADTSIESNTIKELSTLVAREHPEVMRMMSIWSGRSRKGSRAIKLSDMLTQTATLDGKSTLRLFQLYWKRSSIWDDCIRQVEFAGFYDELRRQFRDGLLVDSKRTRTIFSLSKWESLAESDKDGDWFYPAHITVRKIPNAGRQGDPIKFNVSTFVQLHSIRGDKLSEISAIAKNLRKKYSRAERGIAENQRNILIFRAVDLDPVEASRETVSQMAALDAALAHLR